jgi:hypothetical protein
LGLRFATTTNVAAHELRRLIGAADARKHRAPFAAEVDAELEEPVCALDERGFLDARDAKVNAPEILRRDLAGPAAAAGAGSVVGMGVSRIFCTLAAVEARRERLVFVDRGAKQRRLDVAPMRDRSRRGKASARSAIAGSTGFR